MKRKYIFRGSRRILRREDLEMRIQIPGFCGYAHLLRAKELSQPLVMYKQIPQPYACVAMDKDYAWLTLLPDEGGIAVTGILGPDDSIVQVYVDVIAANGVDDNGPWFDDLYVDIILLEKDLVFIDDLDELAQAAEKGEIPRELEQFALQKAEQVKSSMQQDPDAWYELVESALHAMKEGNA